MIRKRTVFVLGAGASVPYSLPTGWELMREILGMLKNESVRKELVSSYPTWLSEGILDEFRGKLAESGAPSIDRFLEFQGSHQTLGKLLIAKAILQRERSPSLLTDPGNGDWLRHIWNHMNDGGPAKLAENEVSFVTFNYDRTLEDFFSKAIPALFQVGEARTAKIFHEAVDIIHVHGTIGRYDVGRRSDRHVSYGSELTGPGLLTASKEIRIVSDPSEDGEIDRARERLQAAERVVFLGFAYHPENMQKLGLDSFQLKEGREVLGSAMGLLYAERLGIESRWGFEVDDYDHDCLTFLRNSVMLS